jgi:hypothetical protein
MDGHFRQKSELLDTASVTSVVGRIVIWLTALLVGSGGILHQARRRAVCVQIWRPGWVHCRRWHFFDSTGLLFRVNTLPAHATLELALTQ